jgi:hypothetical protein
MRAGVDSWALRVFFVAFYVGLFAYAAWEIVHAR